MATVLTRRLVVVAVAASLPAQGGLNESRGPLAGAAVAVAIDGGLGGGDAQARVHRNGFQSGPLAPVPPVGMLPDLGTILQAAPAGIDYDDISLGRDDVLFDGTGTSAVLPSSWAVMSFSLRNGAVGDPGPLGLRIRQEVALGSIGSALFSFVQQGTNLPPQQVSRVERSHSRQDLGLTGAAADVDSIDLPSVLGADQATLGGFDPGFLLLDPLPHEIYFTVSHATRALVPLGWWGSGSPTMLRSGASIFVIRRTSLQAPWTTPIVWKHWFDLGLGQDEDIDGLAIDTPRARVLFSCTGNARNQFLVLDGISLLVPVPQVAKKADGTPVSQATGISATDDVDAICTLDPTIGTQGGPPPGGDDFGSSCGSPRPGLLGVPSVHASAFRRYSGGGRFYDTWMVGWPPVTGITAGIAALFVNVGADPTLFPAGIQLRSTTSSVPGNPISYSLGIPPLLALQGLKITFRWVAVDANFSELAEAWPVQVNL